MELTASQKKTIRYQFDSFCRKILREECRDYFRHINWRNRHEVSFLDLPDEQTILLQTVDEYAVEKTWFQAQEYAIGIHDDQLAEALAALSVEKRDFISVFSGYDGSRNCRQVKCCAQYSAIQKILLTKRNEEKIGGYG